MARAAAGGLVAVAFVAAGHHPQPPPGERLQRVGGAQRRLSFIAAKVIAAKVIATKVLKAMVLGAGGWGRCRSGCSLGLAFHVLLARGFFPVARVIVNGQFAEMS